MKIGNYNFPSIHPCKICGRPSYHGDCPDHPWWEIEIEYIDIVEDDEESEE